jgi:hypothetical protein
LNLKVTTSGGGDFHHCSYSFSGYDKMVPFFETGLEKIHNQPLNLDADSHKIYLECADETGDEAQGTTEFEIIKDTNIPQIARIWQEDSSIIFITTEIAECKYSEVSCNFVWGEGIGIGSSTYHEIASLKGKAYNIKCKDEFGNVPTGCSIKVIAT